MIIVLVVGGCTLRRETKSEKMYILGAALRMVSDSVEATVRYEDSPVGIGDAELLALATKHEPGLLVSFAEYKVRVMREEGHAILLVCDKEGRVGLLEDAGYSSPLDKHLWNEDPPKPCDFTINIATVCPEPAPR